MVLKRCYKTAVHLYLQFFYQIYVTVSVLPCRNTYAPSVTMDALYFFPSFLFIPLFTGFCARFCFTQTSAGAVLEENIGGRGQGKKVDDLF